MACGGGPSTDKEISSEGTVSRSDPANKAVPADAVSAAFAVVADSLQILYYDDPDGDSLRYTRYYSYTSTADTQVLNRLTADLHRPYYETVQRRPCRSEGKIYLFSAAEPSKTVYFSSRNASGCRYLYVIHHGNFLYFDMSAEIAAMLEGNKQHSIRP